MRRALYILGLLADEDIEWLLANGRRRTVVRGDILIHQGVPVESIFILLDGVLDVIIGGQVVAQLGSGEIFGEISLLDSRPPSATISAPGKAIVLDVERATLLRRLENSVDFAARFYRALAVFLAQRLRRAHFSESDVQGADNTDPDEIDPDVMENISIAGARFRWILDRLKERL